VATILAHADAIQGLAERKGRTASLAANMAMAGLKTRASSRENRRATFQT